MSSTLNQEQKLSLLRSWGMGDTQASSIIATNRDIIKAKTEAELKRAYESLKPSKTTGALPQSKATQPEPNASSSDLRSLAERALEEVSRVNLDREAAVLRAGVRDGERLAYLRLIASAGAYTRTTSELESAWIEGIVGQIQSVGLESRVGDEQVSLPPPVDNSHLLESLDRALGE
jgi:hypothetical protein